MEQSSTVTRAESFKQSGFYFGSDKPISCDDVEMFLNGTRSEVGQRLARMQFLPNYLGDCIGWIATWRLHGLISDEDVEKLREALSFANDNSLEQWASSLETSRKLFHLAFRLSERIKHSYERPVTFETITEEFGGRLQTIPGSTDSEAIALFDFEIPPSPYLQFIAEGCKEFERHYKSGLSLIPRGSDSDHPIIGWLASKDGATLSISIICRRPPYGEDAGTPKQILESLLQMLLDLHLHDVRMHSEANAEYTLVSTCALSALWVELRRELAEGRATICPACGKRFVVYGKRQERRLYCDNNDNCKNAYIRTKKVLSYINDGLSPEDASAKVANIGLKRVASIAARNRSALAQEFPNVDFDALAERR